MAKEIKNYYKILGITPKSTLEEIKQAYHKKINEADNLSDIIEAYSVLSDESKKKKYDDKLLKEPKANTTKTHTFKFGNRTYTLSKEKKKGKLKKKFNWGKAIKRTLAGLGVVVLGGIGAFAYDHFLSQKNNDAKPDKPSDSNVSTVESDFVTSSEAFNSIVDTTNTEAIEAKATKLAEQANAAGLEYDRNTLADMIKCINGLDSNMSMNDADDILVELVNAMSVPATNNALFSTSDSVPVIDLTGIVLDDPAKAGVDKMAKNMMGVCIDSQNVKTYAKSALEDMATVVAEDGTVDGFNLNTATPQAKLVWARTAIGANAVIGSLNDDYQISTLDGNTYTKLDLTEFAPYDEIANAAKVELGGKSYY